MSKLSIKNACKSVKGNSNQKTTKYTEIETLLERGSKLGTNDKNVISGWFKSKYRMVYGHEMLGYNFFNCKTVIGQLSERYCINNWEVCIFINKCFQDFHRLGYDQVAWDKTLTLAILKTDWIVDGMKQNKPARSSRASSKTKGYDIHSQSIRQKKGSENVIVEEAF